MANTSTEKTRIAEDSMQKEVIKEALQEWLDKKFAEFGKWALTSVLAAAFVGVIYFILATHGWHKDPTISP